MCARVSTVTGEMTGIGTEPVEYFRLARTIRGPASTPIAPGR
jgi:hypothetical protein